MAENDEHATGLQGFLSQARLRLEDISFFLLVENRILPPFSKVTSVGGGVYIKTICQGA